MTTPVSQGRENTGLSGYSTYTSTSITGITEGNTIVVAVNFPETTAFSSVDSPWFLAFQSSAIYNTNKASTFVFVLEDAPAGDNNFEFTVTVGGRLALAWMELDPAEVGAYQEATVTAGNSAAGTGSPLASGNVTPDEDDGCAIAVFGMQSNNAWIQATTQDTNLSVSSPFTGKYTSHATASTNRPAVALAYNIFSDGSDQGASWSTTESLKGVANAGVLVFALAAGPWSLSGIDAEQVDRGDGVMVTKLTATANNGTVTGNANTLASGTHTTKWDIERDTGTGDIDLSIDGGSTWVDVTGDVGSSSYGECFVEDTLADPQIAIRLATSGDIVYVKNAALVPNCTEAELTGVDTPVTGGAGVKTYVQTPVVQTGEWSGDSWSAITAHPTISYRMDEGSGNTFLARDGDGTLTPAYDATIANVNSGSGGGWNRRD